MNLPPDKVRLLRSYDNEKKWELICDQVSFFERRLSSMNSFCLKETHDNVTLTNTLLKMPLMTADDDSSLQSSCVSIHYSIVLIGFVIINLSN